jgi:hypothetical protein
MNMQHTHGRPRRQVHVVGLGSLTDELVEAALPAYTAQIQKYSPKLREYGRVAGKAIVGGVWGAIFNPRPPKASGPKWLPKVVNPVLDPFVEGIRDEVGPKLLLPVAGLAGLLMFGVYYMGVRSGRKQRSFP